MKGPTDIRHQIATEHLRNLPFIVDVNLSSEGEPTAPDTLTLTTPSGDFDLPLEVISSHLTRMAVGALIGRWSDAATGRACRTRPLLLARYIARPTAQRLIEADINFADRAGNLRLSLGEQYHAIVLGHPDRSRDIAARASSGEKFSELLFAVLMEPHLVGLPVRAIAQKTGIGKTVVAGALGRLFRDGILTRTRGSDGKTAFRITQHAELVALAMRNYETVLRPRLDLGRYRTQENDPERFLLNMGEHFRKARWEWWGFTGSAAAWMLQHYYRGDSVAAFVREVTPEMQRAMRLVPDAEGPITFLRLSPTNITQPVGEGVRTAHPWLVYAELLHEGTPRAIESAERIRQEFLA